MAAVVVKTCYFSICATDVNVVNGSYVQNITRLKIGDVYSTGCGDVSRKHIPKGIRTPVTAVKGRCPRPLDDGDILWS